MAANRTRAFPRLEGVRLGKFIYPKKTCQVLKFYFFYVLFQDGSSANMWDLRQINEPMDVCLYAVVHAVPRKHLPHSRVSIRLILLLSY